MSSPRVCPSCLAKTLHRQPENVYLVTDLSNFDGEYPDESIKVKPWKCSHCKIVLFYEVEEDP